MGLVPEDKEKTAFSTSLGLFHFTRLPYGLVTAPSEFSRLMGEVLRGLQWTECCVYMDDIIVPSSTFKESLQRLEHVFQRLQEARLKLKPRKCTFFQKSVKVLGHVVSEEGIATDSDKITAVRDWPVPTSAKGLKSFIGLASYYKRYVQNFSHIAKPLYRMGEKSAKFVWTEEAQLAFDQLKQVLISVPILGFPQVGNPFLLDTDCSNVAMGSVLSQVQDGKERVIAYMSKTLNKHEVSYCTTRKELLSLVTSVKHFHHYLYGQEVNVRTDNAAVSWMRSLKCPEGQIARWLQYLESYNLHVTHRPGRLHGNADALSRRPCAVCSKLDQKSQEAQETSEEPVTRTLTINMPSDEVAVEIPESTVRAVTRGKQQCREENELKPNELLLDGWHPNDIVSAQVQDQHIGPIISALEKRQQPTWNQISGCSSKTKTLLRHWDRLEMHGGMLYRKWIMDGDRDSHLQLVVPECKQADILHHYHDIPTAAHLATDKMLDRIRQHFYWPAMSDSVDRYCKQCDQCAARKPAKLTKAPLGECPVGEPMEKVAIDILGPLPVTNRGNRFVLVICDLFTKWTEAVAMPDSQADTVATAFIDQFITRMGTPLILLSDLGKCFEARLFQSMCECLQIHKVSTSVMRPQANGVVERFNRTLTSMLTMYCENDQRNWDSFLQQVMLAYRASKHAATGFSPNKMVLGREVNLPMTAVIGMPVSEPTTESSVDDYVLNLQNSLTRAHDLARQALKKQATYRKRHYDVKAKQRTLNVGQAVWLYDPSLKVGVSSKLTSKWKGPYLVVRKIDDMMYLVKRKPTQPAKAHHIDRLRPYQGRDLPRWFLRIELS